MAISVNNIPSINLPLTNEQGIIHPIWYEFFRAVISNLGSSSGGTTASNTVVAGAGIEGTGAVSTVNVGEGSGIIVNANDIAVDITGQINAQAAAEDEILIADASDQSRIRKTSLRDVAALSVANPGGINSHVQYNNNGVFGGDSGLTYDGLGSLTVNSTVTINGTTISSASNSNKFIFNVPAGTSTDHYTFKQTTATGSSSMQARFGSSLASTKFFIDNDIDSGGSTTSFSTLVYAKAGTEKWAIGLDGSSSGSNLVCATNSNLNTGIIFQVSGSTNNMAMSKSFLRYTEASLTASTTQTQGQGALVADVNEVSTVANANDVRTLPAALAGRHCLVINNGANTLQVFPASGDNLGAGVNTSTNIASGSRSLFIAYDTTNWEPVI